MNKRAVLLIEDDAEMQELITDVLQDQFRVLTATTAAEGMDSARSEKPDLILLDIGLPDVNGIQFCQKLRGEAETSKIQVVMLTGSIKEADRVESYLAGADDFLVKPFSREDLIARVTSKIRRLEERDGRDRIITCGNLVMNPNSLEISISDKHHTLSLLEFSLLKFFVQNPNRVFTREQIIKEVWRDRPASERLVDVHLVSLRKKLKGFDHTLATIYAAGYILKSRTSK